MGTLHIRLFGELQLFYDRTRVKTLQSPRLQSLFAYLVLRRGSPHARRQVAFLLYPDSSEAQARGNLRKLLHDLRAALPCGYQKPRPSHG